MKGKYRWSTDVYMHIPPSMNFDESSMIFVKGIGACTFNLDVNETGKLYHANENFGKDYVGNVYRFNRSKKEVVVQAFYNPVGLFK